MIRVLVVVAIIVLSGCAANNQAAIQQDESFADRIDDSVLSSNPNQQKCLEGGLPMIKIGVDPVNPYRFNPKTEDRYKIKIPLFVRTKGKKGNKEVSGCIPPGTVVVVKKGDTKIERIFECGNPILNDIYLPVGNKNIAAKNKNQQEECITWDSVATTGGSTMLAGGIPLIIAGGPPAWIGGGLIVAGGYFFYNGFENNFSPEKKTKSICKAMGGMIGASVGASVGSNNAETGGNSSGDTGGNGDGNGNGNSNGPATPPPVP